MRAHHEPSDTAHIHTHTGADRRWTRRRQQAGGRRGDGERGDRYASLIGVEFVPEKKMKTHMFHATEDHAPPGAFGYG
jgi:hypothetical protein